MRTKRHNADNLLASSPRYLPLTGAELKKATLPGDAPPRPLTKVELAQWLGTTPRFLETEVRRGALRACRLGKRSVRFLPSDVAAWMNANTTVDECAA
jgi:excisionase family DNA binding protein